MKFNQVENVKWDPYFDTCVSNVTDQAVFSTKDPSLQLIHLLTSTASSVISKTQCKPTSRRCLTLLSNVKQLSRKGESAMSCFSAAHI